MDKSQEIQ